MARPMPIELAASIGMIRVVMGNTVPPILGRDGDGIRQFQGWMNPN
jgi:hypothetical protein